MRIRLCILVLWLIPSLAVAQKKLVEYTSTFEIPSWMPDVVARGVCVEQAKSEAIANEFGERLRSETTVSLFNDQASARGESVTQEINSRIVPGVWLGDAEGYPKIQRAVEDNRFIFRVTVKGWAIQHNNTSIPIELKVLSKGDDPSFEGTDFKDGDNMFVWMKTPVAGYVCIYLYDHQAERAYCLLPYSKAQDGAYAVSADEDYVFFSPEKERDKSVKADRLVMTSNSPIEYNMLYILFSPQKFSRPNSQYGQQNINRKLILPRSMDYAYFMKWKADMLTADSQMEERSVMLRIKKK